MSKRVWPKVFVTIGLLLIMAGLAIYLTLPRYGSEWLNRFFLPEGMSIHRLEIGYPGWRDLNLKLVELTHPSLGSIIIESARLQYHLPSLISGEFEKITVNKATITPTDLISRPASDNNKLTPLLPGSYLARIPTKHLTVNSVILDLSPWQQGSVQLSVLWDNREIRLDGAVELKEVLPHPLNISAGVDKQNHWRFSALTDDAEQLDPVQVALEGQLALKDDQLLVSVFNPGDISVPLSLLHHNAPKGLVTLALPNGLQLRSQGKDISGSWSAEGRITGLYRQDSEVLGRFYLQNPLWKSTEQQLEGKIFLESQIEQWRIPELNLQAKGFLAAISGQLSANLSSGDQHLRLHWSEPQVVQLEKLNHSGWEADMVQLTLPPQTLTLSLPQAIISPLQVRTSVNSLRELKANGSGTSLAAITSSVTIEQPEPASFSFAADVSEFPLGLPQEEAGSRLQLVVPPLGFSGRVNMSAQGERVDFQLKNTCDATLLRGIWEQSPEGQRLKASLDYSFSQAHSLRRHLNYPDLSWDLVDGRLMGELLWRSASTAPELSLKGEGLSGYMPTGRFEGVQLQLSSEGLTSFPIQVNARKLETGVPATDVQYTGALREHGNSKAWQLAIHKATAELLGGHVALEQQTLNLSEPSTLIVSADKLDLKRLIETQQVEGVVAEGLISGTIPVTLKDFVPSINDGFVRAVQEGVIQYQSPLGGANINPDLQLALDVLSNFNYKVLESSVDYSPEGALTLTSKIEGSNPDVAGGKRVNLNLNTELDLKSALYALRLQSGLDELLSEHFSLSSSLQGHQFCN